MVFYSIIYVLRQACKDCYTVIARLRVETCTYQIQRFSGIGEQCAIIFCR